MDDYETRLNELIDAQEEIYREFSSDGRGREQWKEYFALEEELLRLEYDEDLENREGTKDYGRQPAPWGEKQIVDFQSQRETRELHLKQSAAQLIVVSVSARDYSVAMEQALEWCKFTKEYYSIQSLEAVALLRAAAKVLGFDVSDLK